MQKWSKRELVQAEKGGEERGAMLPVTEGDSGKPSLALTGEKGEGSL